MVGTNNQELVVHHFGWLHAQLQGHGLPRLTYNLKILEHEK
jgi:hypothetical protein